jgi:hypothetical protein
MDENDKRYVFSNLDDILYFAAWVNENFSSTEEYELWFDHSMEQLIPTDLFCTRQRLPKTDMEKCPECSAQFSTKAGLDVHTTVVHKRKIDNSKFWDIIEHSFNDTQEDHHEPKLPDTD